VEIQEVDLGQGLELAGGKQLKFLKDEKEYWVTRCDKCFDSDKTLKKFQKCEVYSRVCGYIRPVGQYNKAKVAEYKDRINFKNPMDTEVIVEPASENVEETTAEEVVETPVETPAQ
jgi:hypothetical protein